MSSCTVNIPTVGYVSNGVLFRNCLVALKVLSKTVADNILRLFFIIFSKNIILSI